MFFLVFNEDCGGYLNDSRGVVAYQRTTNDTAETPVDCFWVIETQTGKEIEFEINVLETLETFPCKDYLLVSGTLFRSVKTGLEQFAIAKHNAIISVAEQCSKT